ncbi:unnamed protein product [Bursaphelenchus okinawaensis]|uniref:EMI domain-containing protein n=1 Tax=Bursaphelenchus okinawaensis TaxID=465554 RepID=A0A811LRT1_9BILA|nr:unnamed protein product [Bursaphelenchus okinawaensis]CAG9127275.1 unnamed protein product [Bursaphelenchus okinawaensis]
MNVLKEVHQEHERRKRFVDGNKQLEQLDLHIYCEKKFSYNCPTNLLTISIDWMNAKDSVVPQDTRRCCPGYTSRAGTCQKD